MMLLWATAVPQPARAVDGDIVVGAVGCGDADYLTDGTNDDVEIAAALADAADGDIVALCAGRYEYGADVEYTDSTIGITIRGAGAGSTILDGNGDWHLLTVTASNVELVIEGITFEDAEAERGSAVFLNDSDARSSSVVIRDAEFLNNSSEHGGAVTIKNGDLAVYDTLFEGNEARSGAAIKVFGGSIYVAGSNFANNVATQRGGAIVGRDATIGIANSDFTGNAAGKSGGAVFQGGYYYVFDVVDSYFSDNSADQDGGAIFVWDGNRHLTIAGSEFRSNSAGEQGGGVYIDDSGNSPREAEMALTRNKFTANTAASGGGLYFSLNSAGSGSRFLLPTGIDANRFSRNLAAVGGGMTFETNYNGTISSRLERSLSQALRRNRFQVNRATDDRRSANIKVVN